MNDKRVDSKMIDGIDGSGAPMGSEEAVPGSGQESALAGTSMLVELDATPVDSEICQMGSEVPRAELDTARRIVHLEDFEPACVLAPGEADAYRRRFVTLFAEDAAARAGGSAHVMRVANLWGEGFALKVLKPNPETSDAMLQLKAGGCPTEGTTAREEAFYREFRLHCKVSGIKGFPRVYGFGRVAGSCAIVMEWIEGVTLAHAMRLLSLDDEGRMSPLVVARIGRDLFDLVARMDMMEGAFAHGDISTGNILVRTDRQALADQVDEGAFDLCLVDFGSAKAMESAASVGQKGANALEAFGGATSEFAAPELLGDAAKASGEDGAKDMLNTLAGMRAADVYAAANVLWRMATGRAPFAAQGAEERARDAKAAGCTAEWATTHSEGDVTATLLREPEVAVAVRRAAADITRRVEPDAVADALCCVDEMLGRVLEPCLSFDVSSRPKASQIREALGSFSFHYAENVARALRGDPLIAPVPGSRADGYGAAVRRRRAIARACGKGIAVAFAVCVACASGLIATQMRDPFAAWSRVEGAFAGVVTALLLTLPLLFGAVARKGSRGLRRVFRGIAGALVGALLCCVAYVVGWPSTEQLAVSLGASAAVSFGAACACVALDENAWMARSKERKKRSLLPASSAKEREDER